MHDIHYCNFRAFYEDGKQPMEIGQASEARAFVFKIANTDQIRHGYGTHVSLSLSIV